MEVRVTIPGMPDGFFECSEPAIVANWGNCVKGTGDPAVSPHDVPAANMLLTMGGE